MNRLTPAKVSVMMFAVVALLVGAYVAKRLFAVEDSPAQIVTRNVPMAVADIPAGTTVTEEHIGLGPFPVDELEPDMLLNSRVIAGRITREPIRAATPLRAGQFYQPGEKPPLKVAEGMQAVSVPLAESSDVVDGLIKPGQHVDVHMTLSGGDNDPRLGGGLTLTLFKGVRVLAMNRSFQQSNVADASNSTVLELTPAQTNVMILASRRGQITLTFNPDGTGDGGVAASQADRATLDDILGLAPLPKPESPFVTESYRQDGREVYYFRNGRRWDSPQVDKAASRTSGVKTGVSTETAPSGLKESSKRFNEPAAEPAA